MSTITWTDVDKLVRKMHEDRGMLPCGSTDAEVAHAYLKYLQRSYRLLEVQKEQVKNRLAAATAQKEKLEQELLDRKPNKTKQRLAVLESTVAELRQHVGLL
ncbi:MAG: hypothetical protein J6F32_06950 [Pseudomonas sp.]|nr:hypothetical protein [Pseudomonas sp.]